MHNCGAITSHLRRGPAVGAARDGTLIKGIPTSCHGTFFSCGSGTGNKGCISLQQIPADLQMLTDFTGPTLPNLLFVFQREIFDGGNFYQSVFLVLLLQAAAAETFLPLSSPPSPPLPKGNSMGSPLLWPHAATKLSSPGGDGACAIAGSLHLRPQCGHSVPRCICIQLACFLRRSAEGNDWLLLGKGNTEFGKLQSLLNHKVEREN